MNEKIISALIGLVGACENNGKTENTDAIVLKALLNCFEPEEETAIVAAITKEKYTISPNCETCPTPCGNTSNYDMNQFYANQEIGKAKTDMLREAVHLAERLHTAGKKELPEEIYCALSYFRYNLEKDSYEQLTDKLTHMVTK